MHEGSQEMRLLLDLEFAVQLVEYLHLFGKARVYRRDVVFIDCWGLAGLLLAIFRHAACMPALFGHIGLHA